MLLEQFDVFASGTGAYHTYRIPSLVITTRGTLLAFCEGRKHDRGDAGDIDLLLRRSTDGGRTWGEPQIVWDDGENTCGNPCPVVDPATGAIWLLLTHNLGSDAERQLVLGGAKGNRTVWVTSSTDDGLTWARPREITRDVMPDTWRWYATGPGAGIALSSDRLIVPCDHKLGGGASYKDPAVHFSHVIYSDDHGQTWKRGGAAGPGANECEAVELSDGSVLLNMRSYRGENRRLVAISRDGGATWGEATPDRTLIEPICQASIRRVPVNSGRDAIVFSNPASLKRERLTVRLSDDDCKTWRSARVLHEGPAAYSCLTALPDGTIGCFYERGEKDPYERLTLARFDLAWLIGS